MHQKWPNDILFSNEGKIGGVLVESQSIGNHMKIVLGIVSQSFSHMSLDEKGYPTVKGDTTVEFHQFDEGYMLI